MAIIPTLCVRCKKGFDFELYQGLCPHCGCFHRMPGQSLNGVPYSSEEKTVVKPQRGTVEAQYEKHLNRDKMAGKAHENAHKVSKADPHETQMKRDVERYPKSFQDAGADQRRKPSVSAGNEKAGRRKPGCGGSLAVILIAVCILAETGMSFIPKLIDRIESALEISKTVGQYELLHEGMSTYDVYEVYTLGNTSSIASRFGLQMENGRELLAVSMTAGYTGDALSENDMRLPYIIADDEKIEPYEINEIYDVAAGFGIEGELLDFRTIFAEGGEYTGYIFFAVPTESERLDVLVTCYDDMGHKSLYSVENISVESVYGSYDQDEYRDEDYEEIPWDEEFGNDDFGMDLIPFFGN